MICVTLIKQRGGPCLHNVVSCCRHHTDGSIKIISLDLLPITFLGLVCYSFNLIFRLQSKCHIRVCLIRLQQADISILSVCFSRNYILLVSSVLLSTCAKHFFFCWCAKLVLVITNLVSSSICVESMIHTLLSHLSSSISILSSYCYFFL